MTVGRLVVNTLLGVWLRCGQPNSRGLSTPGGQDSLNARHHQCQAGVRVDTLLQMRRTFNKDNLARGTDMSFQ
jgi:hypothetical protein